LDKQLRNAQAASLDRNSTSATSAKLLNATNARSKSTVTSSQRRQTRQSTRQTILCCDELTGFHARRQPWPSSFICWSWWRTCIQY